ncbi:hypothetical protein Taro_017379 [Colocasia esculenta]|uniref:Uncharacterized protein n=1 Tax=Colocasia esculenta TaxID=4460 RepID=A0A843UG30_COLES|nr:hypothetical protein [Colocasia esculenta]
MITTNSLLKSLKKQSTQPFRHNPQRLNGSLLALESQEILEDPANLSSKYIPWDEIERKRRLRDWLLHVQHEALQEEDLPPSPSLSLFNEDAEITVEQLDSMFSSFSCYMVFIPPPKELQTSTIDTAAQAGSKPTTLVYQRRPPGSWRASKSSISHYQASR